MIKHSDSMEAISTALAAAQAEVENVTKDAKNPHFRSSYATLGAIIDTVRPVFSKHGLSVVQIPGYADGVVTVETLITHASGEWIRGTSGAPIGKADAQGVGSATTYLRRYSLAAIANIAQEDDDGNGASQPRREDREQGNGQTRGGYGRADSASTSGTTNGSSEPWDTVLRFGKQKGKKLGELTEKDLRSLIDWCGKAEDPSKFAQLVSDAEATLNRHAGN